MTRMPRLLAVATLAALLFSAVPAAAPAAGWSFFDSLSPLDWVDFLWTQAGSMIKPSGLPHPEAGNGIAPSGTPQHIWGEEGSTMDPLGRSAATPSNGGTWIDPLAQQ